MNLTTGYSGYSPYNQGGYGCLAGYAAPSASTFSSYGGDALGSAYGLGGLAATSVADTLTLKADSR